MELYEIVLQPQSAFGTPLKGDTLFGHFCWQAAYHPELLNGGLKPWVRRYPEAPAVIFSTAYPRFSGKVRRYALPRPHRPTLRAVSSELTAEERKERLRQRKVDQSKRWLWVDDDLLVHDEPDRLASGMDVVHRVHEEMGGSRGWPRPQSAPDNFCVSIKQMHNTIDRSTGTTGEGAFAPFEEGALCYLPGMQLAVFVLIHPDATDIERVVEGVRRIGRWGYGKNATTGLGRFTVQKWSRCRRPPLGRDQGCYTLAPCVPGPGEFKELFYTPFVRFGRHGDRLAQASNPFKNPVLMADEGAVGLPARSDAPQKAYVGRAVLGTSKALKATVAQGYSMYLPIAWENGYERNL